METTKEKRRQELVLAAFNQIAQHGFEGLRTGDVAVEVGVNIATLHYCFPTKESLIRGVLERAMGRFRSTLAPHWVASVSCGTTCAPCESCSWRNMSWAA